MPYISCDEALCDEKAYFGYDCHGDHWVPDSASDETFYIKSLTDSCIIPGTDCTEYDIICAQFDANDSESDVK